MSRWLEVPAHVTELDGGLPALGTCAGMIVLARATTGGAQPLVGGMDIVVRRNAFGRQVASFEAALQVPALGPEPMMGRILGSSIAPPPPAARKASCSARVARRVGSSRVTSASCIATAGESASSGVRPGA